jgi:hypothetical protein
MKKIILICITVVCGALAYILIAQCTNDSKHTLYANHETLSHERYEAMQAELDSCRTEKDTSTLNFLSARLEVQLKLEEYRIKFREAEHVKFSLFFSVIWTALGTVFTGFITLYIAYHTDWKKS